MRKSPAVLLGWQLLAAAMEAAAPLAVAREVARAPVVLVLVLVFLSAAVDSLLLPRLRGLLHGVKVWFVAGASARKSESVMESVLCGIC